MTIEQELHTRSGSKCELCSATEDLRAYEVSPSVNSNADEHILICQHCYEQIEDPEKIDVHHWRCLNDSMWSPVAAVQVMAWRILTRLGDESWAQDLLDMLYLDDETLAWAKKGLLPVNTEDEIRHLDSNGALLQAGDTVTLIKDLNVKGANFTAKRGTAVRGITLVSNNPEQIEGRVNGQRIVILTQFVKKAG